MALSNNVSDSSSSLPAKVGGLAAAGHRGSRPPVGAPDAAPDVDWGRYRTAIRRFKWPVLLVTLTGTLAGIIVAQFVGPIYAAHASVWIEGANQKTPPPPGSVWSADPLGTTGWVDLSRAYVVIEPVVRSLRLYLKPDEPNDSTVLSSFGVKETFRSGRYRLEVDSTGRSFTLQPRRGVVLERGGVVLERGTVGDSVGAALGFTWIPSTAELTPWRRIDFTVESLNEAASQLMQKLRVKTDLDGNFLRIELRGRQPARITAIVNGISRRIVEAAGDLKRQQLTELVSILTGQLTRAQENLRTSEAALRGFLGKTVNFVTEGSAGVAPAVEFAHDPALARYFETKVSLEQVRRDRAAIERLIAQAPDSGLPVDALTAIGAVDRSTELAAALRDLTAKRAQLRALPSRYTDAHLPVQRVARDVQTLEQHTIPALAQALVGELATTEADLTRRVSEASGGLRQIPDLAIEEVRLQRDVANAERLFTSVQQRYDETRLAESTSIPDIRVVDPATEPDIPVLYTLPFLVLAGLLGSFGLAALGAVILDRADSKVRYPDQVTQKMGLTILGALPRVSGNGDHVNMVIEAFRAVRLNAAHAHGTGPVMITITSPGRSDGKSFVASNLALAFADVGYKTLLVDGDVRRGGLHRVLKGMRKPGLTDVLAGQVPTGEAIQATGNAGLSFLSCGSRTVNGPELLSTAAMSRLMSNLRSTYSVILVDTPPLNAGVDAYVLGTVTGSLALVLRTGVSDRELAEAKLDVLDHLPIRVLGAVLNDVQPNGAYRYYSYYVSGYEALDETGSKRILGTTD